jgi:hypothetical protein
VLALTDWPKSVPVVAGTTVTLLPL